MASCTSLLTLLFGLLRHRHDERVKERAHQTSPACLSVRLVAITDTLHLTFQSACISFSSRGASLHQLPAFAAVNILSNRSFRKQRCWLHNTELFCSNHLPPPVKVLLSYLYVSAVVACDDSLNPLNPELNPICYLLALLGAHHFLHVSRIRVKLLTFRRLMSYIYGAPILDVSRSHTTTQHSR